MWFDWNDTNEEMYCKMKQNDRALPHKKESYEPHPLIPLVMDPSIRSINMTITKRAAPIHRGDTARGESNSEALTAHHPADRALSSSFPIPNITPGSVLHMGGCYPCPAPALPCYR
ncbi:hypothetical protein SDJN03_01770, partial [Cucurbita argyrosperma subsp. sororia]